MLLLTVSHLAADLGLGPRTRETANNCDPSSRTPNTLIWSLEHQICTCYTNIYAGYIHKIKIFLKKKGGGESENSSDYHLKI